MTNRVVYKYPIYSGVNDLDLPAGARLLHVAEQEPERVFLWALVDPYAPLQRRVVQCEPTGLKGILDEIDEMIYIGTVHLQSGLVFHAFEVRRAP